MLNLTKRYDGELPIGLQTFATQEPVLARLLAGRGVNSLDELNVTLSAMLPANGLKGLVDAVSLLDWALDNQQKILIVGDFDCDGATSTALMMRVLQEMGGKVEFLVPDRFKYGYGLTPEIVLLGIELYQPDVIVTVDNGISSHAGVDLARQHGIKVIITDHHLTSKAKPNADAVVNPNQLECNFASKALVGVGVAFYVLGNLAKVRRLAGKSSIEVSRYFDLVALGTVADVGVFDQNNRILVTYGLQAVRSGRCCVGIQALLKQAGRPLNTVNVQDFGFILGPRINASGRMDNMRIGIECLLTDDMAVAEKLAYQLNQLNTERRQVEQAMKQQADDYLQKLAITDTQPKRGIVLYQDDWHQGVIGIVAGRLKEKYHRPVIVFAPADNEKTTNDDFIKGSARSIQGIHIRDMIEAVAERYPELISHFGGHAMAGGLTILRKNFSAFAQAFQEVLAQIDENIFIEQQLTDGQLSSENLNIMFAQRLQNFSIWGHGFFPPIFDNIFYVINHRILKDKHLKLTLQFAGVSETIDAIWFNYHQQSWQANAKHVHILFELAINEWQDTQRLQLMIKNLAIVD